MLLEDLGAKLLQCQKMQVLGANGSEPGQSILDGLDACVRIGQHQHIAGTLGLDQVGSLDGQRGGLARAGQGAYEQRGRLAVEGQVLVKSGVKPWLRVHAVTAPSRLSIAELGHEGRFEPGQPMSTAGR